MCENKQERISVGRLNYEVNKHHKQAVQEQIDRRLFEGIELSAKPSETFARAVKNVYLDELQKQISYQHTEKIRNSDGNNTGRLSMGSHNTPLSRSSYRDYQVEKNVIVDNHIFQNYDAGASFFTEQQRYKNRMQPFRDETKSILEHQVMEKYNCKQPALERISYNEKENSMRLRMEELPEKRLHNPILNPIEYHVQNPYILRSIQQKQTKDSKKRVNNLWDSNIY